MNDEAVGRVHWSFWAIGAVALIWNAMGVMNFFMQMNADTLASFPESQRAIIEGRPTWATAGFAIAVFGGALGCLLLLLRKSAAFYLFVASLLGVIVTVTHTIGVASSTIDFSPFEILMALVVAAFLIWYSKQAGNKGWIGQEQSVSH
ncbi:MAG: hypothetical protein IH911_05290 [Proteobacteria bacterium]|nr:hypothetical protein [Pseudomonadota bacterium]